MIIENSRIKRKGKRGTTAPARHIINSVYKNKNVSLAMHLSARTTQAGRARNANVERSLNPFG